MVTISDSGKIQAFLTFLLDKIGNHLFRQCIGIPMGTNCAKLLLNLYLYSHEVEFLRSMKKSNKKFTGL